MFDSPRISFFLEKNTNKILTILLLSVFAASIGFSAYLSRQKQDTELQAQLGQESRPCQDLEVNQTIPVKGGFDSTIHLWKANCSQSCSDTANNSDCPKNTFDQPNITAATSNWCYGFTDGKKCLKLVRKVCQTGTEPQCFAQATTVPTPSTCTIGFQIPGVPDACVSCIVSNSSLVSDMKNLNPQQFNTCSNGQLVNYWCNGAISQQGTTDCNVIKNGVCAAICGFGVSPTPIISGTTPFTLEGIQSGPTVTTTLSAGGIQLTFSLRLLGVGIVAGGNPQPKTPTRKMTTEIYNSSNTLVATTQSDIIYDSPSGMFKGSVVLSSLISDVYTMKMSTERYLKILVPGSHSLVQNSTYTVPTFVMIAGDVNADNLINILDWNIVVQNCFGKKKDTGTCGTSSVKADLNDDGNIDGIDHDLLLEALRIQQGN